MNFSELLSALGMETKLDLSAAVKAGGCTIQFDQNLDLVLEADTDSGQVQMYVAVAQVPATSRENFFSALLQLHLFGLATDGGIFGLDAQLDRVLFFKTLPLPQLDRAGALRQIEVFVNQAERWRDRLVEVAAKMAPAVTSASDLPMQRA